MQTFVPDARSKRIFYCSQVSVSAIIYLAFLSLKVESTFVHVLFIYSEVPVISICIHYGIRVISLAYSYMHGVITFNKRGYYIAKGRTAFKKVGRLFCR